MSLLIEHIRHLRILALAIPLFLVFTGMKVPDFSRPNKPKPVRRAVLDKTPVETVKQSIVKVYLDPIVASHAILDLPVAENHSPVVQPFHSSIPFQPVSPLPPRAPPA